MYTSKNPANNPVDTRLILSALWVARMLSSLHGDVMRLMQPGMLEEMLSGTTDVPITNTMLLVMSFIMAIPIFMIFLSLTLQHKANRLTNLIIGSFFVLFEVVFLFLFYFQAPGFEAFWGVCYLIFAALVVWYAWNWRKTED